MSKIQRNTRYVYQKDGVDILLTESPETKAAIRKREKLKKATGWSILGALVFVLILNLIILPLTSALPRVESVASYDGDNPHIVFDETKGALISAHRAGGGTAPEETMMAFKQCLDTYDVNILEFDLHLTKDGHLVLLHDHKLDRTSNSDEHFGESGVIVNDKTLAELKELNMGENFVDPEGETPYKGLRGDDIPDDIKILELNELLTYVQANSDGMQYIIEIKDKGDIGRTAMDKLYDTMVKFGIVEDTIVGTFNNDITKYIDQKYADREDGVNVRRSASIMEVVNFYYAFLWGIDLGKRDIKYSVLQVPYKAFTFNLGTKACIDYGHKYGIAMQYWTINEEQEIYELMMNGADAVMTDRLDNAEAARDRYYKDTGRV